MVGYVGGGGRKKKVKKEPSIDNSLLARVNRVLDDVNTLKTGFRCVSAKKETKVQLSNLDGTAKPKKQIDKYPDRRVENAPGVSIRFAPKKGPNRPKGFTEIAAHIAAKFPGPDAYDVRKANDGAYEKMPVRTGDSWGDAPDGLAEKKEALCGTPGPGTYDVTTAVEARDKKKGRPKFGRSDRVTATDLVMIEAEGTPGPGKYTSELTWDRSLSIPHADRDRDSSLAKHLQEAKDTPSPFDYQSNTPEKNAKQGYSFPKHEAQSCLDGLISHANDVPGVGSYTLDDPREWLKCGGKFGQQVVRDDEMERLKAKHATPSPAEYQSLSHEHYSFARSQRVHAKKSDGETVLCNWYPPNDLSCVKVVNKVHVVEQEGSAFSDDDLHRQLISRLVSRPLASALGATAPGPASSVDLIDLVYEDGIGDLNVSVGGLDRTRSGADSSGHQGEPVSRELTTSMSVNTEKRGGSARSAGDGDADESNKQGNSTIRSVAFERAQSIRARPGSRPGARPPLPAPSPSPSSSGSQFAEPDAGTSAGPPHDHLKQNQAGTQPSSLHGPASSQGRRSSVSRDRRGSVTRDSQSHRYGKQGSDNPHEKVLTHEKHAAPPRTAGKPGAPSQSARAQKAALICDDAETARVKFAKKRRLAKEYYQTIENVKKLLESHEIDTYDLKTSVPPPDDEVAWALAEAQDQALIDFLQTVHECMLTQPPAELDPVDGDVANKIDSLPQHNNRGKRARERDEEMSVSRVLQKKPARGTKWREGVLAHDRELVAAPNATGPVYRFGGRIMVSDFYSGGVPHPRLPSRRVPDAFIHDKHPPLNDVVTDIKVKEMEKLEKQAEQEALEKQRAMLLDELKDGSGVEKLIESQIAHALRQQTKNERESAQATRERIRARVNELLCMVRLGRIPKSFVLQVLDHYARIDTWQRLHTSKGEAQLALVPDRTSYEAQPYHKHVSNMYRTNHAFRRSNQRCQDAIARARDFDVATIFRPSTAPGGRPRPRSPSPVRVLPRSHPHPEKKSSDRPLPQPKTPQSTPAARPASPPPCEPCGPQPQLAPSKARRHSHPGHGADVVGHGNAAALSAGGHAHAGTRTAAAEEHIAGSGAGMGASTSLSTLKYDTLASQNTSLTRGRPKSASARPAPHSQPTIGSRNKPREHVRSRRGSCRTDDDDTHVRSDDAEEEFESDSTIQNYTCDVDGGGGEGLATNVTPGRGVGTKSPHGPSRAASLPRNTSIPTEHVHKPVAKADSMVSKQTPTSHRDTSPGAGASLRCRESVPPTTLVPSKDDPTTDVSRHPGSPDPAGNHLSNRADHHHHHRHHQTGTRPTSAFRRSPKRTGGSPKEGPQSGPKVAGPGDVLLGSPGLTFRITEPSVSSVESLASMSSLGLMPHPNAPWQRQASQCAETVSLSSPSNENRAPHGVAEDATAVVAHSGGHPEADLTVDDFDDEVARIQQKREGEDEAIRFRRESRKGLVHDGQLDTPEGGSAAECSSPEQRMVRIRRMRKAGLPFSVAPIDFQKLVAKEFPETRSPTIANGTHSRQNTSPTRRATKEPTTELRGVESAWSVVADDHSTSSCALPARLVPPPLRQSLPLDLSSVAGGSSPVSRVAPGVRGGNAGTSASHHSPKGVGGGKTGASASHHSPKDYRRAASVSGGESSPKADHHRRSATVMSSFPQPATSAEGVSTGNCVHTTVAGDDSPDAVHRTIVYASGVVSNIPKVGLQRAASAGPSDQPSRQPVLRRSHTADGDAILGYDSESAPRGQLSPKALLTTSSRGHDSAATAARTTEDDNLDRMAMFGGSRGKKRRHAFRPASASGLRGQGSRMGSSPEGTTAAAAAKLASGGGEVMSAKKRRPKSAMARSNDRKRTAGPAAPTPFMRYVHGQDDDRLRREFMKLRINPKGHLRGSLCQP